MFSNETDNKVEPQNGLKQKRKDKKSSYREQEKKMKRQMAQYGKNGMHLQQGPVPSALPPQT